MTIDHQAIEAGRQRQAEHREHAGIGPSGDTAIDAYRLIHRAVRTAPIPTLPDGFASHVARAVRDHDERAHLEVICMAVAIVLAVVAAITFAAPVVVTSMSALIASTPNVPWPLLTVSLFGLLAVACVDRVIPARAARNA